MHPATSIARGSARTGRPPAATPAFCASYGLTRSLPRPRAPVSPAPSPPPAASPTVRPGPNAANPRDHQPNPERCHESPSGSTGPTSSLYRSPTASDRPPPDTRRSRPPSSPTPIPTAEPLGATPPPTNPTTSHVRAAPQS